LDIGFIALLYTLVGTTINYSVIADLHNLKITAVNIKFSPARSVSTSRLLAAASNNGDYSASRAQVLM
jgi:hypothetical protein